VEWSPDQPIDDDEYDADLFSPVAPITDDDDSLTSFSLLFKSRNLTTYSPSTTLLSHFILAWTNER
jgi:hypothetical protein